jgi:hypothetical protein
MHLATFFWMTTGIGFAQEAEAPGETTEPAVEVGDEEVATEPETQERVCPELEPCPAIVPCPEPAPPPPRPASPSPSPSKERAFAVDMEIDPVAFALGGMSLHIGLRTDVSRIDFGVYSLGVPALFHGVEDVQVFLSGFELRYDHTIHEKTRGLYLGAQITVNRVEFVQVSTSESAVTRDVRLGVQVGYRIQILEAGLYVNPWLGVFYRAGVDSVDVGSIDFVEPRISPFPAVHVGWLFG